MKVRHLKLLFANTIVVLCLSGCFYSPKYMDYSKKRIYDFKPEWQNGLFTLNDSTDIESRIDINGYYGAAFNSDTAHTWPFLLFANGSFVSLGFCDSSLSKEQARNIDLTDMDVLYDKGNIGGRYVLRNDTIEMDKYYMAVYEVWELVKLKFVIVDRQHLRLVQQQYFSAMHDSVIKLGRDELYEFIPVKKVLPNTCVMVKREKWMWHSMDERKVWRRMVRKAISNN